jgi:uncharacterized protein with HEPN domain
MTPLEEAERQSRLWHLADFCSAVLEFTSGRSIADYKADRMLRSAVERELSKLGEAMRRLRQVYPDISLQITDVPGIIGFRNQLIHNYPAIDADDVWEIVQQEIPRLLAEVRALLPPA